MNNCWLFHKWERWGKPEIYEVTMVLTGVKGQAKYQTRKCLRCGMVQERRVD